MGTQKNEKGAWRLYFLGNEQKQTEAGE